jgi:hypothetical protein
VRQGLGSVGQVTLAPLHTPAVHTSPVLQTEPSSQDAPSFAGRYTQLLPLQASDVLREGAILTAPPRARRQLASYHGLESSHERGEPTHTPPSQRSLTVQKLWSLQTVPLASSEASQAPVVALQTPGALRQRESGAFVDVAVPQRARTILRCRKASDSPSCRPRPNSSRQPCTGRRPASCCSIRCRPRVRGCALQPRKVQTCLEVRSP